MRDALAAGRTTLSEVEAKALLAATAFRSCRRR